MGITKIKEKICFVLILRLQKPLRKKPIVALESTVISHGLPYPENIELAKTMEEIIRENGATPATIAFIEGKPKVGLETEDMKKLAGDKVEKVSLRNIALVMEDKLTGATTVAGTMWAAKEVGIKVFATGGIGGVHPGASMDISADLPALASINVAVVCSGPKSILDLPKTREWLETWGIPILGYKTEYLPAFYTRESDLNVDKRVDSPQKAAKYIEAHLKLQRSGIIIGSPIPKEYHLEIEYFNKLYTKAKKEIEIENIKGARLTPFLLSFLVKESEGKTLQSNLALLKNNAEVAAKIAVCLKKYKFSVKFGLWS